MQLYLKVLLIYVTNSVTGADAHIKTTHFTHSQLFQSTASFYSLLGGSGGGGGGGVGGGGCSLYYVVF